MKPSGISSGGQQIDGNVCFKCTFQPLANVVAIGGITEHALTGPYTKEAAESIDRTIKRAWIESKREFTIECSIEIFRS